MNRKLFAIIIILLQSIVFATPSENQNIWIPFHGNVSVLVNKPNNVISYEKLRYVLILTGYKDNENSRLYELLADKLSNSGHLVVRFSWHENLKNQSPEKSDDNNQKVLLAGLIMAPVYLCCELGIPRDIVVISKSWGSRIFANWQKRYFSPLPHHYVNLLKRHVLITPNCSLTNRFDDQYGRLLSETERTSIVISKTDQFCDFDQIKSSQYIKFPQYPVDIETPIGDHNFSLQSIDETEFNLNMVSTYITNWVRRN